MLRFLKPRILLPAVTLAMFSPQLLAVNVSANWPFDIAQTTMGGPPKNWTFGGNAKEYYRTWTDVAQGLPIGNRCSIIEMWGYRPNGVDVRNGENPSTRFATVMQAISAESYRGQRVRFSAQLSTVEVAGQAALWMRVDGQNGKILNFDNMAARPITGTTPWNRYDIVLDVPAESAVIQFGYLLAGGGKAKAAQFRFEVVDASTPLTAAGVPATNEVLPKTPSNLDLRL